MGNLSKIPDLIHYLRAIIQKAWELDENVARGIETG